MLCLYYSTTIIIEVKYHTITRDCLLVDPDNEDYSDGCHTKLPSYGPVRSVFQYFFGSTDIGKVEFEGQACYETKDKFSKDISLGSKLVTGGRLQYALILCVAMVLMKIVIWC